MDVTTEHQPTICDIDFKVVADPTPGCLHQIGPKSLGGHSWKKNDAYLDICEAWGSETDFWFLGPCPFFAWIGICKKVFDVNETSLLTDFWFAQLLGTVDWDLDLDEKFKFAVHRVATMAIRNIAYVRSMAWTGLLTMDQQTYNRQVQYKCKPKPTVLTTFLLQCPER